MTRVEHREVQLSMWEQSNKPKWFVDGRPQSNRGLLKHIGEVCDDEIAKGGVGKPTLHHAAEQIASVDDLKVTLG